MADNVTTLVVVSRKEAIAKGLLKYFTGKSCKHGHLSERYVFGWKCRGCSDDGAIRWREKNPERWKETKAAYNRQEFMREWSKEWRKENVEIVRSHKRNAKAKRRLARGQHSEDDIADILKAQRNRCAYCKIKLKKYQVDHIIAIAKGGTNFRQNIQIACGPCNRAKSAKDPIDFSRSLGKLL